jgi:hypothetical protein
MPANLTSMTSGIDLILMESFRLSSHEKRRQLVRYLHYDILDGGGRFWLLTRLLLKGF